MKNKRKEKERKKEKKRVSGVRRPALPRISSREKGRSSHRTQWPGRRTCRRPVRVSTQSTPM